MDAGDWAAAREALEGVLAIEQDHPGSLNKLGVCLVETGDASGAEAMFRKALEVDPKMAQAYSNLGNIELVRGNASGARDLYLQALKLDPDYSLAHHNLSAAYKRLGQIDKAVAELKKARSLEAQHGRPTGYAAPEQSRPTRSRLGCVFWLVILGIMIAIIMFLR
jgi:Flp pilus assembly protein TadD